MQKQTWRIPMEPLEEIEMMLSQKCTDRNKIVKELSERYVGQNAKSLNEVYNCDYRKTVLDLRTERPPFYITIYSKKPLSNQAAYAIAASYSHEAQIKTSLTKKDFLEYLIWCYCGFKDIEEINNRIQLYEYINDELIIVLDINPEKLGFDPIIMKWTKAFNIKEDNGRYKTIIKAYSDFDIVVNSNNPLSIEEVISISKAHNKAESWVCEGEEGATYSEFLTALEDKEFSKKIKSYEYNYGYLSIKID